MYNIIVSLLISFDYWPKILKTPFAGDDFCISPHFCICYVSLVTNLVLPILCLTTAQPKPLKTPGFISNPPTYDKLGRQSLRSILCYLQITYTMTSPFEYVLSIHSSPKQIRTGSELIHDATPLLSGSIVSLFPLSYAEDIGEKRVGCRAPVAFSGKSASHDRWVSPMSWFRTLSLANTWYESGEA